MKRLDGHTTLDGLKPFIQCRNGAAGIGAHPKTGPLPRALLLASFELIHTANRQTVTNHNAIRFRVAAWKAGSSVGEFEVSQFSQILQIQPTAIAGAGARIDGV
jgi:hypothetical protein